MTLYDRIAEVAKNIWQSPTSIRIISQLNYAASISAVNEGKYDDIIEKVVAILEEGIKEEGTLITKKTALEAEEALLPMAEVAKSYKVHCVSHAHIDMNWLWGYQETASVTVDTFRTVLDLMHEYPQMTFAQSQASTYKIIEDYAPQMLPEIKELIKEGRWEVSASTWVECDKNLPNGESLARHLLYTKRYLSELLDIPAESLNLDFEPDTFGHNATVPEICSKGGVKYYYHCRGNDHMDFAYRWRSPSGAELVTWRDPIWYNYACNGNMFENVPKHCRKYGLPMYLMVYGLGDHGGGPSRRDINVILEAMTWPVMPEIIFSTYGAFFKELEKYKDQLPVLECELNYIFTGCYTSQARIKMANRIAEDRAYESEFLSSSAFSFIGGNRQTKSFEEAWRRILFNQFHDIIPGSGVRDTREYALGKFQEAMASIQTNANLSMRAFAEAIDTSALYADDIENDATSEGAGVGFNTHQSYGFGTPRVDRGAGKRRVIHLFNTTQYDFDGVADFTIWDYRYPQDRVIVTTTDGEVVPHKLISNKGWYWGHAYFTYAVRVKVPAMGYATYVLDQKSIESVSVDGPIIISERVSKIYDTDVVLENDLVKAVFDRPTMQLISMVDKKTGEDVIAVPACDFRLITESPVHGMSSWRIGEYMSTEYINEAHNIKITEISGGGVRRWVKYETKYGERSTLKVTVTLDDNSRMLKFNVETDFQELGSDNGIPQLNFIAPVAYQTEKYRYDIPYATIDRDAIAHDVSANSFAAAIPADGCDVAVMMVSDTKYGFRGNNNAISLTLLRASYNPDPYPDCGVHNINIGVGIVDNCENDTLYRARAEFVHPMMSCSTRAGKGELPLSGRFIDITGDALINAVKTAEDSDAMVIRLADKAGRGGVSTLKFPKAAVAAFECDINENLGAELTVTDGAVSVAVEPHAVKTIVVKF